MDTGTKKIIMMVDNDRYTGVLQLRMDLLNHAKAVIEAINDHKWDAVFIRKKIEEMHCCIENFGDLVDRLLSVVIKKKSHQLYQLLIDKNTRDVSIIYVRTCSICILMITHHVYAFGIGNNGCTYACRGACKGFLPK
jgi:hypothetical protein